LERLIDRISDELRTAARVRAQSFLTIEASAAVTSLLPGWAGGELAATCSWADDERRRYPWSGALHFADTPGDCQFFYDSNKLPRLSIIAGILNNLSLLACCGLMVLVLSLARGLPQHERREGHVCSWRNQQLHRSPDELVCSM
jgi:hypothetical protein